MLRFKDTEFKRDVCILKKYNSGYKLTMHRILRTSGLENENKVITKKGSVNTEKLNSNIARAKSKIFEYADCNEWWYFITLTIDGKKYNRFDLEKIIKDLNNFINNYNKKHNLKIKRLFVPEKHIDGAWHIHGLLMGLPLEHLTEFTLDKKLPKYIREKIKKGEKIYYWKAYQDKFGFCDIEKIKNKNAISKYITKYITMDLEKTITEINAHLYYCSKGLKGAEEIKRGYLAAGYDLNPNFENDYVKIQWFDYDADVLFLKDLIDEI